jgi:hypothetical protein
VPLDMLDRLCLDPGTRTICELMRERDGETRRVRRDVYRLSRKQEASKIDRGISEEAASTEHLEPALNAQRLSV